MLKIINILNHLRGQTSESKALRMIKQANNKMVKSVRKATPKEDAIEKFDIVIETTFGQYIGVQVKSSQAGFHEHIRMYPRVPVILINEETQLYQVQKRLNVILQSKKKNPEWPHPLKPKKEEA